MDVINIMNRKIHSVRPESTIQEASNLMTKENIGAVIVIKDDVIRGILTEKDILRAIQESIPLNSSVKKIMHEEIILIDPYTSVEKAAKIMVEKDIRRLPVISNEACIGIITMKDVLKALIK